jgi:hypothetical protein
MSPASHFSVYQTEWPELATIDSSNRKTKLITDDITLPATRCTEHRPTFRPDAYRAARASALLPSSYPRAHER